MNNGYIKLYRKMLDNPVVTKDAISLAIWIYLLLNATHKEQEIMFKGQKITLQPGQLVTGIISISKKMKVDKNKVQRTLKLFENDKQIEQQTSNKNRLITIVNWKLYQDIDKENEKQVRNKWETSEKQVITNNNDNNVINIKKRKINKKKKSEKQFENMFNEFWTSYPKKRNKQKCKEWYLKNKPTEELHGKILLGITFYSSTEDWKKDNGQFIPYPSTFLNQKRWEDFNNE